MVESALAWPTLCHRPKIVVQVLVPLVRRGRAALVVPLRAEHRRDVELGARVRPKGVVQVEEPTDALRRGRSDALARTTSVPTTIDVPGAAVLLARAGRAQRARGATPAAIAVLATEPVSAGLVRRKGRMTDVADSMRAASGPAAPTVEQAPEHLARVGRVRVGRGLAVAPGSGRMRRAAVRVVRPAPMLQVPRDRVLAPRPPSAGRAAKPASVGRAAPRLLADRVWAMVLVDRVRARRAAVQVTSVGRAPEVFVAVPIVAARVVAVPDVVVRVVAVPDATVAVVAATVGVGPTVAVVGAHRSSGAS